MYKIFRFQHYNIHCKFRPLVSDFSYTQLIQEFGHCGFRTDHAVNLYTSPDLQAWTFVRYRSTSMHLQTSSPGHLSGIGQPLDISRPSGLDICQVKANLYTSPDLKVWTFVRYRSTSTHLQTFRYGHLSGIGQPLYISRPQVLDICQV